MNHELIDLKADVVSITSDSQNKGEQIEELLANGKLKVSEEENSLEITMLTLRQLSKRVVNCVKLLMC